MKSLTEKTSLATAWWILLLTKLPRYRYLFRKLWWIVALTTASGLALSAWRASKQPVVYVSNARIMVSGKFALPEGTPYSEEMANFTGTQMELMKSPEVRQRAAARIASQHPNLTQSGVKLDVTQLPRTSIFVLSTTGDGPEYTREFLNACMEEYIIMRKEMRSEKSDTTLSALTGELARIEKEIRAGEDELLVFQKQNAVGPLEQEGNSAGTYLASLNRQLADLRTEYQLLILLDLDQTLDRSKKKEAETGDNPSGKDSLLGNSGPGSDYLQAKQAIEVLKSKRDEMARASAQNTPT